MAPTPHPPVNQAYTTGTGVETEGIDLEVSGALTPNWNVYGSYTYLHFRRLNVPTAKATRRTCSKRQPPTVCQVL